MWIPMWIICMGTMCQQMELVDEMVFKSKEECEKFAIQTAQEFAKDYERVGYKCTKSDNI